MPTIFHIGELKTDYPLVVPESILIANHKPFFNKNFIHDLANEAMKEKFIIINKGNHGSLKNSCTNFWWVEHLELDNPLSEGATVN